MAGIVLVHGAWFGGWSWHRLSPILREMGYTVADGDLPGKGAALAEKEKVTLEDQLDCLSSWMETMPDTVHLVAHGMAGILITEYAERRPERIASVTYMSSLFGQPGEWAITLPYNQDVNSGISHLEDGEAIEVTHKEVAELSFNDCTPEDYVMFENSLERVSYDPPIPPLENTTGHWESIQRAYIMCMKNKMVLRAQQHQMTVRHKCSPVIKMNTGHCPFLTQPKETAEIIDDIVSRVQPTKNNQPAAMSGSQAAHLRIVK